MAMDNVISKHNIIADVEPMDITSITDGVADLVLTSNEISKQIEDKVSCPTIVIRNFMDEQEIVLTPDRFLAFGQTDARIIVNYRSSFAVIQKYNTFNNFW